jgi:hypothetical protein
MGRSDLFRIGITMFVVMTWVMAGISMRESPLMKAKEVMNCYTNQRCFSGHSESSLVDVSGALSREMDCAMMEDSAWATRIPCCEFETMHLTMREILFLIGTLGMNSTCEFLGENSEHFRVTLKHGTGEKTGRLLRLDFLRMGDHYYLQDIHGLCELLTRLSLADHEQSLSREFKEP